MRIGKKRRAKSKNSSYHPVDILKTIKEIESFKAAAMYNPRDLAYIVLALNTGYRCGDILSLKIGDVVAGNADKKIQVARVIGRREQKTGWGNVRALGYKVRNTIREYLLTRRPIQKDEPLFLSRQKDKEGKMGAISIDRINGLLSYYASKAGIPGRIRSHSLRKTFGYFAYRQCKDIAKVQALFGHSSSDITLRYIGIEQEELSGITSGLDL